MSNCSPKCLSILNSPGTSRVRSPFQNPHQHWVLQSFFTFVLLGCEERPSQELCCGGSMSGFLFPFPLFKYSLTYGEAEHPLVKSLAICKAWSISTSCSLLIFLLSSVQFSRSVVSDSWRSYGLQHTRSPCPSLTPGACSNSILLLLIDL